MRADTLRVLAICCVATWACAKPSTPKEAEDLYRKEQLACVMKAHTLAESKACRADVDKQWGRKP